MSKKFDLHERLIDFAVDVLRVVEELPNDQGGRHVAGQLIRSGTSPAANYAEAQSAESRKDFVHKLKIALKELRESLTWLQIIKRKPLCGEERLGDVLNECNELISILVKSVLTTKRNSGMVN